MKWGPRWTQRMIARSDNRPASLCPCGRSTDSGDGVMILILPDIGLVMLAEALREAWVHRRHAESSLRGGGRRGAFAGLVLATGLSPCASAIIILLFALGQGLYLVGIAASLVMAVVMGLTVCLIGLVAVATRRGTLCIASPSPTMAYWMRSSLGIAGAAAIAGLGLLLLLSVWTSV